MYRIFTFLSAILTALMAHAATFPTVSTDTHPIYYYIQMQNGKGVITSMGNDANVQTAAPVADKKDLQTWKVVQTSGGYTLTNPAGQTLYYNTTAARFRAATAPSGTSELKIIATTNTTYTGYEISTTGSGRTFLNQWGGAGMGKQLGLWDQGDPNNPLQFLTADEITILDTPPASVPEVTVNGTTTWTPQNKHTLWYTAPATVWMTSTLPIGNGQFGGCIMGGVKRDEVQFNDKTLWWGHLGSIVANGSYGSYLDFGHLYITSTDEALTTASNYRRWLDIDESKAGVAYTANGVDYTREYICSYPDKVIAIKYSASQAGKINENILLYNVNGNSARYSVEGTTGVITFEGKVTRTGTTNDESYYCSARIVAKGGTVSAGEGGGINVQGADEMYIYLYGTTNFDASNDDYISDATLLPGNVKQVVEAAATKGYEAILSAHTADYKALYDRCNLNITDAMPTVPTRTLISNFATSPASNLLLEEIYFNYGRYLMISSSRGVDLPSNLQGIWNNSNSPAWNSDIHSNINVQMNYWPAEITNLSELHMPFLNYIHREACERPQWRANAREVAGQTVGWTLTTENNIYGSGSTWGKNYTIANAWYCMHLWQHYRFTLDKEYLRTVAYPAMRSCAEYWLERLVLAADGTYECPREYSPEHGPQSENATAHSQQLVWDLFNNTLQAISELGLTEDATFLTDLNNKFAKLDKGLATEVVNGQTLLREWKYTSQAGYGYNNHRHMSHLMGLYPGNQIAADIDPVIYQAAVNSLNARGYAGTGWSMGWKINLHARVHNGDVCQDLLHTALHIQNYTGNSEGGGVYENLWDAHTPYQIDGNFGATAGMAEMLLQSHLGKLEILPALPSKTWTTGSVKGLRAVGGFEVDINWADGKATTVKVTSNAGKDVVLKYAKAASTFDITDGAGNVVPFKVINSNEITFPTTAGTTYTLVASDKTMGARCDTISDGDYYIKSTENGSFLSMDGTTNKCLLQSEADGDRSVWTISSIAAADAPAFLKVKPSETEGRIYFLTNKGTGRYIRQQFASVTTRNLLSVHPIYINSYDNTYAIRATNGKGSTGSTAVYNGWYGVSYGTLTATDTEPRYDWILERIGPPSGIHAVGTGAETVSTRFFLPDGTEVGRPTGTGVYISVEKLTNGKTRNSKVLIKK